MFVQVIQGKVSDAAQVRAHLDKWVAEVAPGAIGWLGSTGGVTEDGNLIALVRFESEEAAQQNSDRPEQGEWWETDGVVLRTTSRRSTTARRSRWTPPEILRKPASCR